MVGGDGLSQVGLLVIGGGDAVAPTRSENGQKNKEKRSWGWNRTIDLERSDRGTWVWPDDV